MAETRVSVFDQACKAGRDIFIERDAEYGHSTASTGVLGATVELIGNVAKLRKMVLKSPDQGASKSAEIAEVLKDIHNYANIALMELADENFTGV